MVHKMVQVAFANIRRLYRLNADNSPGENDHVWLAPFFHSKVSHQCARVSLCSCKQLKGDDVTNQETPVAVVTYNALEVTDGVAATDSAVAADSVGGRDGAMQLVPVPMSVDAAGTRMDVTDEVGASNCVAVTNSVRAVDAHAGQNAAAEPDATGVADAAVVGDATGDPSAVADHAGDAVATTGLVDDAFVNLTGVVDETEPASGNLPDGDQALDKLLHGWLLVEHARCTHGQSVPNPKPLDTQPFSKEALAFARRLIDHPPAEAVRPRNKARIFLKGADFLRLAGESWLKDELINSIVALINERAAQLHPGGTLHEEALGGDALSGAGDRFMPRTRILNSFFFSRLAPLPSRCSYDRLRNWGVKMGLDLDSIDKIIVPVNMDGLH